MQFEAFLVFFLVINCHALYKGAPAVIELNDDNFNKLVENSKDIWLVEFFAPWCGHCQNFAPEFKKAAKALEGVVKVGAVNADENPALTGEFEVRGYPTIKIFSSRKGTPRDYEGERTAKAMVSFLLATIQSKVNKRLGENISLFKFRDISELTDENFEDKVLGPEQMWLVVFYSPLCEHCKTLSLYWSKVTSDLKGMVKLGALDATSNKATISNCNIEAFPTIQLFFGGNKTFTSGITYSGKQSGEDIIQWTMEKILEHSSPPEIKQIIDYESLQKACDQKPLCVVSVLPDILDCKAQCRNDYINTLRNVSANYKTFSWGWVWSEAGAQPGIEEALEIGGFGYPAVAAVNVKKMRYSLFVGSFSFDGFNKFLRDLSYGRGDTKPITAQEMPDIKTVEQWDGLDADVTEQGMVTELPFEKTGEANTDEYSEIKDEL